MVHPAIPLIPGTSPDDELEVIRRILAMLERMPACRVAATLTTEGVPCPDNGRHRTDRGVRHPTSGVWHQPTILNIARNPLLRAITSYGRRSMGDQLRFAPGGPRDLSESDLGTDGKPKVVTNTRSDCIESNARFEPLVDPEKHHQLLEKLEQRGSTQRGKPRSRDPKQNPLGSRVFDMACGWPMYRQPYNQSFRYLCGMYQQSHGSECRHNCVDGMLAARFVLTSVRQRVLDPTVCAKLEQKLRALAERERGNGRVDSVIASQRAALAEVKRKKELASKNLAFAESVAQRKAVAEVFDSLVEESGGWNLLYDKPWIRRTSRSIWMEKFRQLWPGWLG